LHCIASQEVIRDAAAIKIKQTTEVREQAMNPFCDAENLENNVFIHNYLSSVNTGINAMESFQQLYQ
jgi:hypothetical protein